MAFEDNNTRASRGVCLGSCWRLVPCLSRVLPRLRPWGACIDDFLCLRTGVACCLRSDQTGLGHQLKLHQRHQSSCALDAPGMHLGCALEAGNRPGRVPVGMVSLRVLHASYRRPKD